jgi:predicted MFS family arabinose efflux permease
MLSDLANRQLCEAVCSNRVLSEDQRNTDEPPTAVLEMRNGQREVARDMLPPDSLGRTVHMSEQSILDQVQGPDGPASNEILASTIASPDGEPPSLWQNHAFLNLWAAESISQFGTQVTMIALPLIAALTLDASPLQMGILSAAMTAPALLIGLFVGVWVDRLRRRPLLIGADFARAMALLAIPAAWWLDVLSISVLFGVALIVGSFTVVFDIAYISFLPSLIRKDQLVDGNSKLEISVSTAQVGGPAIGGVLVGAMTPPLVIIIDALSYIASAVFLLRIRDDERLGRSQPVRAPMIQEIMEGLRALLRNKILRVLAASSATLNLFGYAFLAVYVLYMTDDLGLGPGAIGLVFGAGGIGALIGAILAGPLSKRFGTGPTIVSARLAFGVCGLLVPAALNFPTIALQMVVAAEFLQWMALVAGDVNARSLRQVLTPDQLLGRINATFKVLVGGAIPIGALIGGVLGEIVGIRATLVIGVIGMLVAFVWLLLAPVWNIRNPEDAALVQVDR